MLLLRVIVLGGLLGLGWVVACAELREQEKILLYEEYYWVEEMVNDIQRPIEWNHDKLKKMRVVGRSRHIKQKLLNAFDVKLSKFAVGLDIIAKNKAWEARADRNKKSLDFIDEEIEKLSRSMRKRMMQTRVVNEKMVAGYEERLEKLAWHMGIYLNSIVEPQYGVGRPVEIIEQNFVKELRSLSGVSEVSEMSH